MSDSSILKVDANLFKLEGNLSVLIEAAQKLFTESEQNFEQVKSQTWYTRLWKLVTFSKDNQKLQAKNITSLAKAQDIVLKLLLVLSEDNKEIAAMVGELSHSVLKLTDASGRIAIKLVEVTNYIKYNYQPSYSIAEMSDAKKSVLISSLNYIADQYHAQPHVSDFLIAIVKLAGFNERRSEFDVDNMQYTDKESEAILPILLQMNVACMSSFEYCKEIATVIDHLHISSARKKMLQQEVESEINRLGIVGIIELYDSNHISFEIDSSIDDEDMEYDLWEFEEAFIEEELEPEQIELTEIVISNILRINESESVKFENNIVYVHSYVDCSGSLSFENCEIYYHDEPGTSWQVTLNTGSELTIKNCKIVCLGINEKPLFKVDSNTNVTIENSILISCRNFITMEDYGKSSAFYMRNCEIINPNSSFIKLEGRVNMNMERCYVHFTKLSPDNDKLLRGDIIYAYSESEDYQIRISEVIVQGDHLAHSDDQSIFDLGSKTLFSLSNGHYINCTFNNVNNCITRAKIVSHCHFIKCKNVITNGQSIKNTEIKQSVFHTCEEIIKGEALNISHCQFIDCINNLIEGTYGGGVKVEFCEFDNIKFLKKYSSSNPACLTFNRTKDKDSESNKVKKCVFKGVNLQQGFLIAGKAYEKIKRSVVYLEECSFQNCTTERESGKIIKSYDVYYNLFNKKIQQQVTSISNCSGLEKVNQANGYVEDVVIKAKDDKGIMIGATAIAVGIVSPLGAIGVLTAMTLKKTLIDDMATNVE